MVSNYRNRQNLSGSNSLLLVILCFLQPVCLKTGLSHNMVIVTLAHLKATVIMMEECDVMIIWVQLFKSSLA